MRGSTPQGAQSLPPVEYQGSGYLLRLNGPTTEVLREADDHLEQDDGLHLGQLTQGHFPPQRPEDICFAAQRDHNAAIIGAGDGKSSKSISAGPPLRRWCLRWRESQGARDHS